MNAHLSFFVVNLVLTSLILGVIWTAGGQSRRSRFLLSSVILIFLYANFLVMLIWTDQLRLLAMLYGTFRPLGFLIGPLVYWYVLSLTQSKYEWTEKELFHLIPAIAVFIEIFPYLISHTDLKYDLLLEAQVESTAKWRFALMVGMGLVYLIFSYSLIQERQARLQDQFSSLDQWNLRWLRRCLLATALIWVILLVASIDGIFGENLRYTSMAFSISTYILAFSGLYQSVLFNRSVQEYSQPVVQVAKSPRQWDEAELKRSMGLSIQDFQQDLRLIEHAMVEKKIYRDSALRLRDLAENVGLPEYVVSQLINAGFKMNFFDLVNGYRIREAQDLLGLRSRENSSIIEIAFEAGFNSKSAFNSAFKRYTGKTPSQFRKAALETSSMVSRSGA